MLRSERFRHMNRLSLFLFTKLPPILIALGAVMFHLYLYRVDSRPSLSISVLFLGIFMQSTGLTLLLLPTIFKLNVRIDTRFFLLSIAIFTISTCYMRASRFEVPYGSDVLRELNNAKAVALAGRWDPVWTGWTLGILAPAYKYLGTLSVTIYPNLVTEVLGLNNLETYFRLFAPSIGVFYLLSIYLFIHDFFGDSPVTYISITLVPQILFFSRLLDMTRSAMGLIGMYLMMHCLRKRDQRSYGVAVLLALLVISSHYTLAYFSFFILLTFVILHRPFEIIASSAGKKLHAETFGRSFIPFFFIASLAWFIYCNLPLFSWHVQQLETFIRLLVSFSFSGPTRRVESYYVFSSPRGTLITAWFDLQFGLMAIGGLIALVGSLRGRFSSRQVTFILSACSSLALITIIAMVPHFSIYLQLDRTISHFLVLLCGLIAVALLELNGRARLLVVIFLLPTLSMNLMLPDHANDIFYHPASELTPERTLDYYSCTLVPPSGVAVGDYIQSHQPSTTGYPISFPGHMVPDDVVGRFQPIVTDTAGLITLMRTAISTENIFQENVPSFYVTAFRRVHYMLLTYLYVKNGLWGAQERRAASGTEGEILKKRPDITAAMILNDPLIALTYCNGDYYYLLHQGDVWNVRDWEPRV